MIYLNVLILLTCVYIYVLHVFHIVADTFNHQRVRLDTLKSVKCTAKLVRNNEAFSVWGLGLVASAVLCSAIHLFLAEFHAPSSEAAPCNWCPCSHRIKMFCHY